MGHCQSRNDPLYLSNKCLSKAVKGKHYRWRMGCNKRNGGRERERLSHTH